MDKQHEKWDSEDDIDKQIRDNDETYMPLPDIEHEPHLLISKVRKHYMKYMIDLLSTNYETHQHLIDKNIYIPSAICKCAKILEMKAAQACMVAQLYRKYIVTLIKEVKRDTKNRKLHINLYETLHNESKNEKRTQTVVTGCNCQCQCNEKKRRRKGSSPLKLPNKELKIDELKNYSPTEKVNSLTLLVQENNNLTTHIQRIPVVTNMQTDHLPMPSAVVNTSQPQIDNTINLPAMIPMNIESDDIMHQLEAIFQSDEDDDDLFACNPMDDNTKTLNSIIDSQDPIVGGTQNALDSINNTQSFGGQSSIIENHAAQIKALDERLSTLTGMMVTNEPPVLLPPQKEIPKKSKQASKWLCEEYFLKKNLFELLYQIRDNNRRKLARVKELYRQLFGEDSDDEEAAVSPAESCRLAASCKARIDRWVRCVLAPHYAQGRIHGKLLYKAVARHLIELIYKCKPYPSRHEVTSFVMDFLENRSKIRCEADFKEFRIDNVLAVSSYAAI